MSLSGAAARGVGRACRNTYLHPNKHIQGVQKNLFNIIIQGVLQ